MYIKLSFTDKPWVITGVSGGIITYLDRTPEIVVDLPSGIVANKAVIMSAPNIAENIPDSEEDLDEYLYDESEDEDASYDYYIDCQKMSRIAIEKAIKLFSNSYDNKLPATYFGDGVDSDSEPESDDEDQEKTRQFITKCRENNKIIVRMNDAIAKIKQIQEKKRTPLSYLFVCCDARYHDAEIQTPSPLPAPTVRHNPFV